MTFNFFPGGGGAKLNATVLVCFLRRDFFFFPPPAAGRFEHQVSPYFRIGLKGNELEVLRASFRFR